MRKCINFNMGHVNMYARVFRPGMSKKLKFS